MEAINAYLSCHGPRLVIAALSLCAAACGSSSNTADAGSTVDARVPDSGSASAAWPNEPAGFSPMTESAFDSLTEGGWTPYYTIGLGQDCDWRLATGILSTSIN
jgi:hypothetical protein